MISTFRDLPVERVHPDVRRRRAAVALAMYEALAHRPYPGESDANAFAEKIADLVLILLPGADPARLLEAQGRYVPQVPSEVASVIWFHLVGRRTRKPPGPEPFTTEIFGGDEPMDGAFYDPPDTRRGAYAGAPRDPDAGPRRIVARLAAAGLESLVEDQDHLARAREVLAWAVDAPLLAREMVIRRTAAGLDRARIVEATGVATASVGHWESGSSIPHPHEWPAVCAVYGFSLPEFARILAVTGPPERRGVRAPKRAAAANADTPPSTLPDLAPDDDCEEGGEQLRRIFDGVARLGASPRWVALQPGDARIGIWCLDLIDGDGEEDDPDAEAVPSSAARRARGAGPVWCEPPPGGVLGPIDLATLVHRPDWALWVIETARHVREFADAQVFASGVDQNAAETLMGEAFHLSYAYQHAHAVHDPVPEADRYVLAAHRAVADALSSVMFVLAAASLSGRRDAGRGPAPDN